MSKILNKKGSIFDFFDIVTQKTPKTLDLSFQNFKPIIPRNFAEEILPKH